MNKDIQSARVNALKISDKLTTSLMALQINKFLAHVLGERRSQITSNRYEYIIDKMYPVVYQHMTVDSELSEDVLLTVAENMLPHMYSVFTKACERAAETLVVKPEWNPLFECIAPYANGRKGDWDASTNELRSDCIYLLGVLVQKHCQTPVSSENSHEWNSVLEQKSLGLSSANTYEKSKTFGYYLAKNEFLTYAYDALTDAIFNEVAAYLQRSREMVLRHASWDLTVQTQSVGHTSGHDGACVESDLKPAVQVMKVNVR